MSDETNNVLFALTTCPACRRTKEFLKKHEVEHVCVDLDIIDKASRKEMLKKVREYNPKETFPTFVVNGGEAVVVGFNEDKLKAALGIA